MLKIDDVEMKTAGSVSREHEVFVVEVAIAKDQLLFEADFRVVRPFLPVGNCGKLIESPSV